MKNKKIYFLIGIGFLLLILAYFSIYLKYYQKEKEKILSEHNTLSVTIIIDYGNGVVDTRKKTLSNANRTEPYTAFEVLNGMFDLDAVEYEWGTSIKCIKNVCEDESTGYYWFFWYNGNFSSVSTEKYYLKDNDIITMKYISSKDVGM